MSTSDSKTAASNPADALREDLAPLSRLPLLGPIAWLYQQSPFHKHFFLSDLEWLVMPPLMSDQFKLFLKEEAPVAYASWAYVSEDVEKRILAGQYRLAPHEWRSGDRLLVIDLLSPFGGNEALLKDLSTHVFPEQPLRLIRRDQSGSFHLDVFEPGGSAP